MQQFYIPTLTKEDKEIHFDKIESKHLSKVLRKKIGDGITIVNGVGYRFEGTLTSVHDKQCTAVVNQCKKITSDPYHLHLYIAPTKSNDRMEWFVEKATEIGVHAITPIICQRSERRVVKQERLHKIAIAAMKQSLGAYLPMIHPFCDFFTALKQLEGKAFIAHCEDTEKVILDSQVLAHKSISIFIGPEGDFSTEEIKAAADENVTAITFGTKRMRTETAGIIACHSVSQLYM